MGIETNLIENMTDNVYYFNKGLHLEAYSFLGSKKAEIDGKVGYMFSVWAPNAHAVFLTGDFNHWDKVRMQQMDGGVWTLFVENAQNGQCYKYGIDHGNGHIEYKMDPFGFRFEVAPKDATIIEDLPAFNWQDDQWITKRQTSNKFEMPLNIYEVHATSWKQHPDGTYYTLTELADSLIPYVKEMGYTHIELMPIMDHPLEASWGYQITGYYGITGRVGRFSELQYFVNLAHQNNIGILMDWVPGHFCKNAYALPYFDGTPTFEYQDVNRANNIGWGTLNFDLGKSQVHSFLISNAMFWLKEFHIDGLRVDAVSNMIYLDFDQGPWTPNVLGTNENLEGIEFLRKLNQTVHQELPGVYMIAEESSSRENITGPLEVEGALGFDYKWNMGWMNDTLRFFELLPFERPNKMALITFVFVYQYKERYILPYSHDEVVHGKHSLLGKITGTRFEQFSTLRLIQGYMAAQPGKVLNFMGNEIGQYLEWRFYSELEWIDLTREFNSEFHQFVKDVNHFSKDTKAMYELDHDEQGLKVIEASETDGYLTLLRFGKQPRDFVIVACNFENKWQNQTIINVPYKGQYSVVLDSNMSKYGGNREQEHDIYRTYEVEGNGETFAIQIDLAPLSIIFLQPKRIYGVKK